MNKLQVHANNPNDSSKSQSKKTHDIKSNEAAKRFPPVYTCLYNISTHNLEKKN